ncbi:guanylate cyclase domain-containing protein [Haematococcus lacustris]|uniref:Guanylate cyclase domain-containing protein n=1 Tax=Haematococcus lacustris TaxID=44745 RepID=A0A699Z730_HAELA|nr:guanylate cyclase domain-containing protein [Haematococcus lacustris]
MIAFEHAADALEWALMVQETMMEAPWTPAMLSLPGCATSLSTEQPGLLLFHGPRVKVGLYQGTPVKVVPHSTTGRADYFGPLVNRAARFCHAAAQGGQEPSTSNKAASLPWWSILLLVLLPGGLAAVALLMLIYSRRLSILQASSSHCLP